jgi:hypothetical protein
LVDSYHGNTYVAYLDISGFSEMMKDLVSAGRVLDNFFATIYRFCEQQNTTLPKICVIVAFDCAALFIRNRNEGDKLNGLLKMLTFVKQANRHFIMGNRSQPFITACSIAYGYFDYEDRAELADLRKNYVFGRPYLDAVLDQKKGKPRMRAGECRLLTKRLPRLGQFRSDSLLSFVLRRGGHRYFYWMLNDPGQQHDFDKDYLVAYKSKRPGDYSKMIQVLRRYINHDPSAMH